MLCGICSTTRLTTAVTMRETKENMKNQVAALPLFGVKYHFRSTIGEIRTTNLEQQSLR